MQILNNNELINISGGTIKIYGFIKVLKYISKLIYTL